LPGRKPPPNSQAIGYYFARALYENLDVPIGLINSTRGASVLRAWVDPTALKSDPAFAGVLEEGAKKRATYPAIKSKLDADIIKWEADKAAAEAAKKLFTTPRPGYGWAGIPDGPDDQFMPSTLYNGVIHPLLPYALHGAIWYQGEGDSGSHIGYTKLFAALITGRRTLFGQGGFPFYWVQLSSYNDPVITNMAFFREAPTNTLSLPNTGQAISIDLVHQGNIHPQCKQEVGRRLARIALARTYSQKIHDSGPEVEKIEREGAGFRVRFKFPQSLASTQRFCRTHNRF
jgi:sialate O-acetylesterase